MAGWAAYQLADVLLHRGDLHGAEAAYARLVEDDLSPDLRGAVIGRLAYARFVLGDAPRAVAMLEAELRAMRSAPAADPDAEVRVVSWLIYFCAELEWFDLGRRLEHEVAGLLGQVRNPEWVGNFYSIAAQLRHGESELDDMERMLAAADRCYRELDLERERGLCHWARGYVQRRARRLAEAAAEFRTARAILDRVGAVQDHAGATIELAEALRRLGEPDEAAALAEEAVTTMRRTRHREGVAQADRLLGVVAAGRGDDAEAERLLVAAADGYAGVGLTADEVNTCGLLGDLLHRQGRRDEAIAVYRRALHAAERLR
ncbi:MAG: tetratricopeptide repeat protein [Streptomycetaceae bacterium]|nr:tetratricopeptide repeat protein [Streptomycetaceae bacterium]